MRLTVDGRAVRVRAGSTVLDAAVAAGADVPTLCHLEGRPQRATCRLCMVRVDGAPRLVSSCSTPAREGMDVVTRDAGIVATRRVVAEMMLLEHGVCGRPRCAVETLARSLGAVSEPKAPPAARARNGQDAGSDYIRLRPDRCVHCERCLRSCPRGVLTPAADRGPGPGFGAASSLGESACATCGMCVAACPAGVLEARLPS